MRLSLVALMAVACGDDGGGGVDGGTVDSVDFPCIDQPDSCDGDQICVAEECVDAFGRTYQFQVLGTQAATMDTNGDPWDPPDGAPDLFVEVALNGSVALMTETIDDSFQVAMFTTTADIEIAAGTQLVVASFDEDVGTNTPVLACVADPLTPALLRGRLVGCTGQGSEQGSSLLVEITPL